MDIEPTKSIHALQLLKSIKRHLRSTRNELQQLSALLLIKGSDSTPEPLDLRGRGRVVVVFGVALPVVDFDFGEAGD
jgi:hypothetical protein